MGAFEEDGRVTAVAGFRLLHTLDGGDVLYVDDLSTMAEARGRGHAGALVDWCAEEGRRLGCPRTAPGLRGRPGAPGRAPPLLPQAAPDHRRTTSRARCSLSALSSAAHTLRRTPLYERHEQAGARLVPVRRLGDAGAVRGHPRRSTWRCARRAGHVRRLAHGRDRDPRARGRGVPPAPALQRRDQDRRAAAPSTRCSAARTAACSTTSSPTGSGGPLPDRHQRRQPRAGPRLVPRARGRLRRRGRGRARPTGRCSPSRAPRRARRWSASPRASCPRACAPPTLAVAGVDCLVCGTGYTGEDGVELLVPPDGAGAVWDALPSRASSPPGLGARDTLRLEVCFHLYGNDLSEDRNPIEAGLGWCCKLDTGFIGSDALRGARARRRRSCRSPSPAPASRARATRCAPSAGDGRRDERHAVALPGDRDRDGLRAGGGRASRARAIEVDVRGKPRAAEVRREAALPEGVEASGRRSSYPDDLKYHPEHDWARIEGDEATFGITWYAQDALGRGRVLRPARGGRPARQGPGLRRGGVREGGVRRVRAAVGRDRRGERGARPTARRTINEDPYGDGLDGAR